MMMRLDKRWQERWRWRWRRLSDRP